MILSFGVDETEDIFNGNPSKKSIRRLHPNLWRIAQRKLHMIHAAKKLEDLRIPPANHLEALVGNLKGYHSIRINDQHRIIFCWSEQGVRLVKITDYH